MGNEWELLKLSEVAEVIDSRHKTPQYSEVGYPMVRVVDVNGGPLNLDNTRKVTEQVYTDFSKGKDPDIGDLVISRVGSYGNISYVVSPEKFCLGQNTAFIIPQINWRYLYYALTSSYVRRQMEFLVVGAVQKTLSLKSIKALEIPVPPEEELDSIAHILGSLDDKIALLRKMNETLEQMAQALFQSWFVDFDPVIDKALAAGHDIPEPLHARAARRQALGDQRQPLPPEIADLFPDAFTFHEDMGWVPEGWEVKKLQAITDIKNGYSFKSKDWTEKGAPVVKIGSVKPMVVDLGKVSYVSPETAELNEKYALSEGDILVGLTGYVGETGRVPFSKTKPLLNQRVGKFMPQDGFYCYVYAGVRSSSFKAYAVARAHGSAQPNVSTKSLLEYPICIPTGLELLSCFDSKVGSDLNKILLNFFNIQTLTSLRDTLLPKLLSGELEVGQVEPNSSTV